MPPRPSVLFHVLGQRLADVLPKMQPTGKVECRLGLALDAEEPLAARLQRRARLLTEQARRRSDARAEFSNDSLCDSPRDGRGRRQSAPRLHVCVGFGQAQSTGRQAFRQIAVEIDFRHTPIGRNSLPVSGEYWR
jgi:hypothetical protein